ncbi:hypothetical protein D4764_0226100 [Takifugu flavidus]|uniref:Uncharacterized protein n=1 Tax=Takifugu flavidus TaxID=433684 RepID=A0A5C6MK95_9TELE|nr:hypothetical protein D4764_0226100 [Takifugu flavidus]
MQKQVAFFPGKLQVVFRKGPLGFLLQEPSDEAKRVSSTPQDKSAGHEGGPLSKKSFTIHARREDGVTVSSEDDQLVGFGARAKSTLQQNLLKRQQPTTSSTPAEHPMKAPAEPLAMEEDVEMEREMQSSDTSDLQVQSCK